MSELVRDWRAWATVFLLLGYLTSCQVARMNKPMPDLTDDEIDNLVRPYVESGALPE